jgi:hypothetical protein
MIGVTCKERECEADLLSTVNGPAN